MTQPSQGVSTDLAQLPRVGTAERREWDRTLREVNELFPDWSAVRIGNARFGRDAYEKLRQETAGRKRSQRPGPFVVSRPQVMSRS
jgi:hypothetical protein